MNLDIPEGYAYYYLKDDKNERFVNKEAIDRLIESDSPPSDMTLDELEAYYVAKLTSARVKLDNWLFHWRVSQEIVRAFGSKWNDVTTSEGDENFDESDVWDNDEFGRLLFDGKNYLHVYVLLNETEQDVRIGLSYLPEGEDSTYTWPDFIEHDPHVWETDADEDDVFWCKKSLVAINFEDKIVDLTPLINAVQPI